MKIQAISSQKEFMVKLTKWGLNIGLRIPIEIVREHNFKDSEKIVVTSTREGFEARKIFPERADNFII